MIMGPAKMMDLASVMLAFSATTVPVNSKKNHLQLRMVLCQVP
jgi:hypothetical protein